MTEKPKNSIKLKQCKVCQTLFYVPKFSHIQICSDQCRRDHDNNQRHLKKLYPSLYPIDIKCKICHNVFRKLHSHQVYCSTTCQIIGEREMRRIKKKRYKRGQEFLNIQVKHYLQPCEIDWAKKRD